MMVRGVGGRGRPRARPQKLRAGLDLVLVRGIRRRQGHPTSTARAQLAATRATSDFRPAYSIRGSSASRSDGRRIAPVTANCQPTGRRVAKVASHIANDNSMRTAPVRTKGNRPCAAHYWSNLSLRRWVACCFLRVAPVPSRATTRQVRTPTPESNSKNQSKVKSKQAGATLQARMRSYLTLPQSPGRQFRCSITRSSRPLFRSMRIVTSC